jgi:hypothetical protein
MTHPNTFPVHVEAAPLEGESMISADTDRNLLFGVIALQTDAITRTQFTDGCALWATQKQRSLADLLAEQAWITAEDRADVEGLVDRKLRRHGGMSIPVWPSWPAMWASDHSLRLRCRKS